MSAIEEKLEVVKKRIAAAKARSPYRQDVTLVAVTKFHPLEDMEEVLRLGVKEVGENRVQELEDKRSRLKMPVVWNLQGHLQKNKVKKAVAAADLIQSVDSVEIMEEIDKRPGRPAKCRMCFWNLIFPEKQASTACRRKVWTKLQRRRECSRISV